MYVVVCGFPVIDLATANCHTALKKRAQREVLFVENIEWGAAYFQALKRRYIFAEVKTFTWPVKL